MKKMLRSFGFFCLAMLMALSFVACGYRPVASTEAESTPIFSFDGKHEVKYELFRFIFLQKKQAESGGDDAYFEGKDKAALLAEYVKEAEREAAKVYALFSLCEKYGIDPYAEEVEEEITAQVELAIQGSESEYGYGSVKAYLKEIGEQYLNDSVYRLYLRYDICERLLSAKLKKDEVITAKWEDVFAYYYGEETVCATWVLIPYSNLSGYTEGMRRTLYEEAKLKSNDDFKKMAAEYAISQDPKELSTGLYFGHYEYDELYSELVETAFSLAEGETSEPFYSGDGLYILRRLPKDMLYLGNENNKEMLNEGYMLHLFGQMLAAEEERLLTTVTYGDAFSSITFDGVKMTEK
ncbi:MAG: peptidylprolyl isomerase [Clostridia bacterium]|nr:peptidylprolyl isomerase [Clostridia bacterium]